MPNHLASPTGTQRAGAEEPDAWTGQNADRFTDEESILGKRGEATFNTDPRPRVKTGRWAGMAVLVVFVGVIVDSGLSSWRIDRPVLAQVVVCLVLVAAGFIWFWIWCGFAGWELGSRLRLSGLTDDHEDELRAKLERRSATASRRETLMGAYLPVAFASFLIGIFVLLY